jgi:hypothetical protein
MMPVRKPLQDVIVSLSLANLMFLRLWMKLLPYKNASGYFLPYSPFNTYLAVILNVVLWGGVFFLLLRLAGRNKQVLTWVVILLFSIVSVAALYGIGLSYISFTKLVFLFGREKVLYLEFAVCMSGVFLGILTVKYRELAARICLVLPLFFSPYLLDTFGQAAAALGHMEPAARFHPHRLDPSSALQNHLWTNIVWVVFDETDYRICFEKRPANLLLPSFDRFKENALWATHAYSPSDSTQISLPALLTGIPLKTTIPAGARQLELVRADSRAPVDFTAQETIFDRIKKRLGSTALFGWFFPYSRIMHNVDLCHDYPRYNYFTSDNLLKVLVFQWAEVWDMRFLPFKNTLLANNHIGIVKSMQSDVLAAIKNQNPSFMFLHYPLPHSPNIYDRKSGTFGLNKNSREGYLDNMALADRCLGGLRAELERKGIWDGALVIISSDHHWRTNTYDGRTDYEHVPFMVKFPHQRKGMTYDGKFNTVLTQYLILAVLDGKVKSPEEASKWLNRIAGTTPFKKVIISIDQPDAD